MNKITLWFSADIDDWTAKRAIIASNARVLSLFSPLKPSLFQADLPLSLKTLSSARDE